MQQKEALNEEHDDSSTTLNLDPRRSPPPHCLKGSQDLPMVSTYNETEIKLLVKVSDADIRTVQVNIETDTVGELKRKVGSR
jgi:hypothetical protein